MQPKGAQQWINWYVTQLEAYLTCPARLFPQSRAMAKSLKQCLRVRVPPDTLGNNRYLCI
jgi:hypothetical protein